MELMIEWANDASYYLRKFLEGKCRDNGLDLYEIMHYPVRCQRGERFRALVGSKTKAVIGVIWWERNWFSSVETTDFDLLMQPDGNFNTGLGSDTVTDKAAGCVAANVVRSVEVEPAYSGLWIDIGVDRTNAILEHNKFAPKFRGNIDLSRMIPAGGRTYAFLKKNGENTVPIIIIGRKAGLILPIFSVIPSWKVCVPR